MSSILGLIQLLLGLFIFTQFLNPEILFFLKKIHLLTCIFSSGLLHYYTENM